MSTHWIRVSRGTITVVERHKSRSLACFRLLVESGLSDAELRAGCGLYKHDPRANADEPNLLPAMLDVAAKRIARTHG